MINLLFVGDTFGRPGRMAIEKCLPELKSKYAIDITVVNCENMAGGKGVTPEICDQMFALGVDVLTTGNHLRDQAEIVPYLDTHPRLLRPANFCTDLAGRGFTFVEVKGIKFAVLSVMGAVHFKNVESPFLIAKRLIDEIRMTTPLIFVDMHAEATSEKRAMGWYLDGRVSAVIGSHTHVQTADEEILPEGTAYLSDAGMTGPYDSVIGLRKDIALERFIEHKRHRFEVAKADVRLCGAVVRIHESSGRAESIERIQVKVPSAYS